MALKFRAHQNTIMKKTNRLCRKHHARAMLLIERNNTIFRYQSDANWPPPANLHILPKNQFTPDNFDTIADRENPQKTTQTPTLNDTSIPNASDVNLTALMAELEGQRVLPTSPTLPSSPSPPSSSSLSSLPTLPTSPSLSSLPALPTSPIPLPCSSPSPPDNRSTGEFNGLMKPSTISRRKARLRKSGLQGKQYFPKFGAS
ncbi:hypothetical protein F5Y02DRAFT_157448 [Annulohypoxylon stygium]|nr:hypothetical protein F5Y02DRAFT_157448 [Annulohypoxylon stygium]